MCPMLGLLSFKLGIVSYCLLYYCLANHLSSTTLAKFSVGCVHFSFGDKKYLVWYVINILSKVFSIIQVSLKYLE